MFGADPDLIFGAMQMAAVVATVTGVLVYGAMRWGRSKGSSSTPEEAPTSKDDLEERVRVLERIATDRSGDLAEEIEALRNPKPSGDKQLEGQDYAMINIWGIVAIVAIVVWGIVQMAKARAGIISDEDGNETFVGRGDDASRAEIEETRREIEQLRERLHVLERIATDNNTMDARDRARIAAEIEALRDPSEPSIHTTPSLTNDAKGKEPSQ